MSWVSRVWRQSLMIRHIGRAAPLMGVCLGVAAGTSLASHALAQEPMDPPAVRAARAWVSTTADKLGGFMTAPPGFMSTNPLAASVGEPPYSLEHGYRGCSNPMGGWDPCSLFVQFSITLKLVAESGAFLDFSLSVNPAVDDLVKRTDDYGAKPVAAGTLKGYPMYRLPAEKSYLRLGVLVGPPGFNNPHVALDQGMRREIKTIAVIVEVSGVAGTPLDAIARSALEQVDYAALAKLITP